MVLAFLMKPGIVPTSGGRLIYIPGEDPLLLETMWYGSLGGGWGGWGFVAASHF